MRHFLQIFGWLMLAAGCNPTGTEHQESVDLVILIEKSPLIKQKLEQERVVSNGVYGTAVPPKIFVDIYLDKRISKGAQRVVIDEVAKNKVGLSIRKKIIITFYEGYLSRSVKFARAVK